MPREAAYARMCEIARRLGFVRGAPVDASDQLAPPPAIAEPPTCMADHGGVLWRIVCGSVRGATHQRNGRPNQDAVAWRSAAGKNVPLAVAVSDGHGSPKCFRSDAGARLAVGLATQLMEAFAARQPAGSSASEITTAPQQLPEELVRAWRQAVEDALNAERFSAAELDALENQAGLASRRAVEENPFIAYGATLLGVLVASSFVLYLQLGDGDILTVSNGGEVTRPVPIDARLLANETTSLCLDGAWRDVRIELQPLASSPPALILVSTDGYANSFGQDADFLKIGTDLLNIVRSSGLDPVKDNLESWLSETSSAGSGDDVTLAVICRSDACLMPKPTPAPSRAP